MYDSNSIESLANSVGFGNTTGTISVVSPNIEGTSGMVFQSFQSLVTPDNLLAVLDKSVAEDQTLFNSELAKIKLDQSRMVLASILDEHPEYDDLTDYSQTILDKLTLLRKAYALSVAKYCLEQMISSKRFNLAERNIRETFSYLKLELEGSKSDSGKRISYGIVDKLRFAIADAQDVIFPPEPTVQSENQW